MNGLGPRKTYLEIFRKIIYQLFDDKIQYIFRVKELFIPSELSSIKEGPNTQPTFTWSKSAIETRREMCSKLKIKTPERSNWRRSGVFAANFEHISHLAPVFLLLTLNM